MRVSNEISTQISDVCMYHPMVESVANDTAFSKRWIASLFVSRRTLSVRLGFIATCQKIVFSSVWMITTIMILVDANVTKNGEIGGLTCYRVVCFEKQDAPWKDLYDFVYWLFQLSRARRVIAWSVNEFLCEKRYRKGTLFSEDNWAFWRFIQR